jgi:protein SCO1/2
MQPLKPLVIALWILAALSVGGYAWLKLSRSGAAPATPADKVEVFVDGRPLETADGSLPVYFAMPDFALTDHSGQPFSSRQLEGKVWIGFIFLTNCPTGACPVMVGKMARLQEALPDERVHFVSVSVDPERDTPEVLAEYAARTSGKDVSRRWHLLTGESREQMTALARSMKLIVDEDFGHSTVFLLVDQEGNVRGSFGNEDPEGMNNLAAAARELLSGGE